MQILLSLVIFFLLIGFLILVHEAGHFFAAKLVKIEVQEFAIGFGPNIFTKKYKGTKYALKLFPFGGYVKMLGDQDGSSFLRYTAQKYDKADKDFSLKLAKANNIDFVTDDFNKIADFVEQQAEMLEQKDYVRLQNYFTKEYIPQHKGNYDNKRFWQKVLVLIAGVSVNFVVGSLIFFVLLAVNSFSIDIIRIGNPTFLGAQQESAPYLREVYNEKYKQYEGTIITKINGEVITSYSQLQNIFQANNDSELNFDGVSAEGNISGKMVFTGKNLNTNFSQQVINQLLVTNVAKESAAEKSGIVTGDVILKINDKELVKMDVLNDLPTYLKSLRGTTAFITLINTNGETKDINVDLPNVADDQPVLGINFSLNAPVASNVIRLNYQQNSALSGLLHAVNITAYNVSGIVELAKQSIQEKSLTPISQGVGSIVGVADIVYSLVKINDFFNILNLTGMISVTLAFMNILPIPLFDGGNLLFVIIEKIRGRKLSDAFQEKVSTVSFFLLIGLMAIVVLKDIFQFNWLGRTVNLIQSNPVLEILAIITGLVLVGLLLQKFVFKTKK